MSYNALDFDAGEAQGRTEKPSGFKAPYTLDASAGGDGSAVPEVPAGIGITDMIHLDHAFILGHNDTDKPFLFNIGDHGQVDQDVDVTDTDLVRFRIRFREDKKNTKTAQVAYAVSGVDPLSDPENPTQVDTADEFVNYDWELSLLLNGSKKVVRTLEAGRQRDFLDLALYVSPLSGLVNVAVRLELISP